MLLRVSCIVCVLLTAPVGAAAACDTVGFQGLDSLRLDRPAKGPIVTGFGMRPHPLLQVPRMHAGLDFAADAGEPVQAAAKGRIAVAAPKGEYGNYILIDHGDGLTTAYGHLSRFEVREGDCVGQGAAIGKAGSTGLSERVQLHFEVIVEGRHIDPAPVIDDAAR